MFPGLGTDYVENACDHFEGQSKYSFQARVNFQARLHIQAQLNIKTRAGVQVTVINHRRAKRQVKMKSTWRPHELLRATLCPLRAGAVLWE